MNLLVKEITKGLLEQERKTIAVYGGGFKPPTKGHFQVVKQALDENQDVDEFLIFVGKGERDGVTQEDSMKIWGIYQQYLPFKVKIREATKPPIQEIYNYAKNNPEEEVLWVIGAREGDEADFEDIANRTKSINKYPNLELRTIVTTGGISGTAARNASKVNKEKLENFLPDFLSDTEKNNIFVILNNEISEADPKKGTGKKPKGSGRRLYTDEDPSDTVKVKFSTRQDIINTLNKTSFKNKSHARQSQVINLIHQRVRAALSRTKDPAKKKKLRSAFEYIKKRKEASKAKTQRLKKQKTNENLSIKTQSKMSFEERLEYYKEYYTNISPSTFNIATEDDTIVIGGLDKSYSPTNINEHASYTDSIDIMEKISALTNHMLAKGMNIKPLPTLEFVDGDSKNASNFLGTTAYYDPDKRHIVLYTEGRHPKDIVRSYAHEMIHHIQNLEGRLGNITTTDTTADDYLTKLEAEANLRGTMTFRGWTDSIKEGKTKDPFGINAYAAELGRLREDEEKDYKIYLDMDGVVADFDKRFEDLSGLLPDDFISKNGKNAFWDLIDEKHKVGFWVGIPPMENAKQLVDFVSQYDYVMLTAPSTKKQSRLGKNLWIRNHTGDIFPTKPRVIFKAAKEKHKVKPQLTDLDILIDDKASTIDNWNASGGTGILYKSAPQVISQLKKLGL